MQRRLSTSHEEGLVARLCARYAIRTVFFDWSTPREEKREERGRDVRRRRTGSRIRADREKENVDDRGTRRESCICRERKRRKRNIGRRLDEEKQENEVEEEGEKEPMERGATRREREANVYPRFRAQQDSTEDRSMCERYVVTHPRGSRFEKYQFRFRIRRNFEGLLVLHAGLKFSTGDVFAIK